MKRYISSFYDGRCRIRHSALKNQEMTSNIEGMLSNIDGVLAVTSNPRTGSLLLEYDVDILPTEALLQMAKPVMESFFGAEELESPELKSGTSSGTSVKINETAAKYVANAQEMGTNLLKQGQCITQTMDGVLKKNITRKAINYSMLASLGASVALSFTGSKSAHVVTGGIFLAGLSAHLLRNRKAL